MAARYVGRASSWARQLCSTSGTPQKAAREARMVMMNVAPAHRLLMWVLLSSAVDRKAGSISTH
jgi:hypothetical protein